MGASKRGLGGLTQLHPHEGYAVSGWAEKLN